MTLDRATLAPVGVEGHILVGDLESQGSSLPETAKPRSARQVPEQRRKVLEREEVPERRGWYVTRIRGGATRPPPRVGALIKSPGNPDVGAQRKTGRWSGQLAELDEIAISEKYGAGREKGARRARDQEVSGD